MKTGKIDNGLSLFLSNQSVEVTVQGNDLIEKSLVAYGFSIPSGYKIANATLGTYGTGSPYIIPHFSGLDLSYITVHNMSNTARTVNLQMIALLRKA